MQKVTQSHEWDNGHAVAIRPAEKPAEGQWCVTWKTSMMRAPAFWYFEDRDEAFDAFNDLYDRYDRLASSSGHTIAGLTSTR